MASSTKQDEKTERSFKMFDSPEFAQMYSSAEKVTGPYAKLLLEKANLDKVPDNEKLVVLDEACGTGIVSVHLMDMLGDTAQNNLELTCADFADPMVNVATKRIESSGWKNAKAIKADGMDTKLPSSHFTHVLLNFGPMIFPDSKVGLREIYRLLRPGGTVAMSTWETLGWYPDVRAALATEPELPKMRVGEKLRELFSPEDRWDDAAFIQELVRSLGFVDVQTESVPQRSRISRNSGIMGMLNGILGQMMTKSWTKEEQEKYSERAKTAVERYMKQKYGEDEIEWDWIAVLTVAKKPE
ncbi:hypothetical protein LTR44_007694 [Exophiala sp. CCFEE 6388]|nr:hypothetical protein LTR44_007694 [Eurotiomycetes sp. CCFEE 6388]